MKRFLAYAVAFILALFVMQEVNRCAVASEQESLFNISESTYQHTGEIADAMDILMAFVEESYAIGKSSARVVPARNTSPTIIINGKVVPAPSYLNRTVGERVPEGIGKPLSANSRLYVLRV